MLSAALLGLPTVVLGSLLKTFAEQAGELVPQIAGRRVLDPGASSIVSKQRMDS